MLVTARRNPVDILRSSRAARIVFRAQNSPLGEADGWDVLRQNAQQQRQRGLALTGQLKGAARWRRGMLSVRLQNRKEPIDGRDGPGGQRIPMHKKSIRDADRDILQAGFGNLNVHVHASV